MSQQKWTPEQDATLKGLIAEGQSYSRIGALLGVSRSAVSGRSNRLGLAVREKRSSFARRRIETDLQRHRRSATAERRQSIRATVRDWYDGPHGDAEPRSPSAIRADLAAKARRLEIADLKRNSCRFPLWETADDPRHYCGSDTLAGTSYCPGHAALCLAIPVRPATAKPAVPSAAAVRSGEHPAADDLVSV